MSGVDWHSRPWAVPAPSPGPRVSGLWLTSRAAVQGDCTGGRGGGEVSPQPPGSLPQPEVPKVVAACVTRPEGLGAPSLAQRSQKLRSSSALQGPGSPASPTITSPRLDARKPRGLWASWGQDRALKAGKLSRGIAGEPPQVLGRRPPAPPAGPFTLTTSVAPSPWPAGQARAHAGDHRAPSDTWRRRLPPPPPPLRTPEEGPATVPGPDQAGRLAPDFSGGHSGRHPHRGSTLHSTQATGTDFKKKIKNRGDKWRRAGWRQGRGDVVTVCSSSLVTAPCYVGWEQTDKERKKLRRGKKKERCPRSN